MQPCFAKELARLGPERSYAPVSLPHARNYCGRLARTHYENFSVASLLLPRRLLRHFHSVYAYCRWADDLADETGGGSQALELLRWWREELLGCYDGRPRHPVMIALRETIQRFQIPPQPFLDLLKAFEQDQQIKRYQTYEQLLDYCRFSANPVGRLVLYLCHSFDGERAALSDHICTGLQLADFWQDIARDLDLGRVYLPEEDRQRFQYRESDLQARRFTAEFAELMRFEVDRTRALFLRGLPLLERIAEDVRPDIELFARGGLAILNAGQVGEGHAGIPCLLASLGGRRILLMSASLARSYTYCERLARREAGNFYHAFRILPRDQRLAMCALYAFLRIADDLTDGPAPVLDKQASLEAWRQSLDQALAGCYRHPALEALHNTVMTHRIPREYLEAVLDGVGMDLAPLRFETFDELSRYCYRVASAVGLACIHIWGFDDERAKVYAENAGIAFQLTNILRDLREDAARGRVYLPRGDLEAFGYTETHLHAGVRDERFRALMRFQVDRARSYYEAAGPLVPLLHPAGRAVFLVMTRTYRGLLDAIEQRDFDVFSSRVSLSSWRKLRLVVQALPVRWGILTG